MKINQDFSLSWIGHATFRVKTPGGKTILVDPWLEENPSCPVSEKKQSGVDLILLTHGHFDHSSDVVQVAQENNAPVLAILEAADWAERAGAPKSIGMNIGGTYNFEGLNISMVEAKHSSSLQENGKTVYVGVPVGFIVKLENGFTIYIAGDTALFGDMTLIGEIYKPDMAILPIGDHFTMNGADAARACRMLGVAHVVPCHYKTFPLLAQNADSLVDNLSANITAHILSPGESIE